VNDKDQTQDVKFVDDHRWELASTFLSRSDHSAEVFRAALLAIATAAIGFVMQNENLAAHIMSLVLFGSAATCVLVSWDIQKKKASDRFKTLRDRGASAYLAMSDKPKNVYWDRAGAILIGAGAIWETAIKLHGG
jgi:hypothetical protein